MSAESLECTHVCTGTESQKIEPGRDSQNEYGLLRRNASAMVQLYNIMCLPSVFLFHVHVCIHGNTCA